MSNQYDDLPDEVEADQTSEPALTGFDIFVLLLSLLSLFNIVLSFLVNDPDVRNVVLIVDIVACLILFADFLVRLRRAPSRRQYFLHDKGWLDMIGSLPVPGLRIARLYRVVQTTRVLRFNRVQRNSLISVSNRAANSLLAAMFLTIVMLEFGSMSMLRAEDGAEGANITSASDALWWSYVTITTVGYGDQYPVSNFGRYIGVAVLTVGIGLFSVLTGFLANLFLGPRRDRKHPKPDPTQDVNVELVELRSLIAELRLLIPAATIRPSSIDPVSELDGSAAGSAAIRDQDKADG